MRIYNTIIVAGDALARKLIKKIVLNSQNANLLKIFPSLSEVEAYISENQVQLLILDPSILDDNYIQLMASIASAYPKMKFLFAVDQGKTYPKDLIETLEINRATFCHFSSDMNSRGDHLDTNLEEVMARYDHILGCLLIRFWEQMKENMKLEKEESFQEEIIWNDADLVLIASSTGGPAALEILFQGLKDKIRQPILMVQHMPEGFTSELCKDIERTSGRKTIEGFDGLEVSDKSVILAPGSYHMVVKKTNDIKIIGLDSSELVNGVRPAADVLFQSVAKVYSKKKILVLVLTGMGSDGLNGIRELKKKCNCYCITQSERTSVVYGMPRAVCEAGLCDEVLDIENMHRRVISLCEG